MKTLRQLSFLFAVYLAAVWLSSLLPFAFPASVLGMALLLLLLFTGVVRPGQIEQGADLLLQNMMFLFLPAGVSIMEYYPLLRGRVLVLLFIALVTLAITLTVTALTVRGVAALLRRRKEAEG